MPNAHVDARVVVHHGDALEALKLLPDASVHSVVTDPPYGIDFMGKGWDSGRMLGQHAQGHEKRGALAYGGAHSRGYADSDNAAFGLWVTVWARECLRVLKPGGHLLAFGGTRTWHRLATGIEDAGFELRDSIAWLYGQGFPHGTDVGKAIDKLLGAERPVLGSAGYSAPDTKTTRAGFAGIGAPEGYSRLVPQITGPGSPEAAPWSGWNTALKPAFEPVVVARKPLAGTVAKNVLAHGTGALNIGACRIGDTVETWPASRSYGGGSPVAFTTAEAVTYAQPTGEAPAGRWPANVILDEHTAAEVDRQSGTSKSAVRRHADTHAAKVNTAALGDYGVAAYDRGHDDAGGASRFFKVVREDASHARSAASPTPTGTTTITPAPSPSDGSAERTTYSTTPTSDPGVLPVADGYGSFRYVAKAGKAERPTYSREGAGNGRQNYGGYKVKACDTCGVRFENSTHSVPPCGHGGWSWVEPLDRKPGTVAHPTVKPLAIMRYLLRLVTPPDGIVLEPFAGSGATVEAALLEGFRVVAIEREADYVPLILQRIERQQRRA